MHKQCSKHKLKLHARTLLLKMCAFRFRQGTWTLAFTLRFLGLCYYSSVYSLVPQFTTQRAADKPGDLTRDLVAGGQQCCTRYHCCTICPLIEM